MPNLETQICVLCIDEKTTNKADYKNVIDHRIFMALISIKGRARYAGFLIAPAKGFGQWIF